MSTNTEILEKIARLLSLADGNANENEAAAAMAAAARLMEKHKIDAATVAAVDLTPEEPIDVTVHDLVDPDMGIQAPTWRWILLAALSRLHGCKAFVVRAGATLDHPARSEWRVIGTSLDASAVRYLYLYASRQIDAFCVRAMANGMGSGKTWGTNFRQAAASRVAERYRDALKKITTETRATATGAALVRVDERAEATALAVRAVHNRLNLRAVSGSSCRHDSSAQAAGREAGNRVDLGTGGGKGALGAGSRGALGK